MRATLKVDAEAPRYVHDLARQTEDAFELVEEGATSGPFTYKADVVDRMTDLELQKFETELLQTTVRMRQKWYAIQRVYHRSADYPEFYGEFVDAFGMDRADQILRPSGRGR